MDEAGRKADEFGMEFIPGMEIGVLMEVEGSEYETHILAYYFSHENPKIRQLCADAKTTCAAGAELFLEGLSSLGISMFRAEVEDEYPGEFSSWALRRMLVHRGSARDKEDATSIQQQAVRHMLDSGAGSATFGKDEILYAADIIALLHDADASVFLAHPFWLTKPERGGLSEATVWKYVEAALKLGVDGPEVYAPAHTAVQRRALLDFCRSRGIPACGGSDSHNAASMLQPHVIEDELLVSIKRHRANLNPWG